MRYYTGIGSRSTPDDVLEYMQAVAARLAVLGFTLRSGGADGADSAFERGAGKYVDIYLPWSSFNARLTSRLSRATADAFALASTVHPGWEYLSRGARALHARNCHQVLGSDLRTKSEFVLCWTPDGCRRETERRKTTGGTATAIVLADRHAIPVFNLQRTGETQRFEDFLTEINSP